MLVDPHRKENAPPGHHGDRRNEGHHDGGAQLHQQPVQRLPAQEARPAVQAPTGKGQDHHRGLDSRKPEDLLGLLDPPPGPQYRGHGAAVGQAGRAEARKRRPQATARPVARRQMLVAKRQSIFTRRQ